MMTGRCNSQTRISPLKVLIAGGGIGGLTAALCLARKGCSVELLEQSDAFTEVGAGIQLSPNCVHVLHDLGLEALLRDVAFLPEATQFRHWRSGKVIAESPLGQVAVDRYDAPYYHMHRGDLLAVLVAAARETTHLKLHTDASLEDFRSTDDGVLVRTTGGQFEADLLIGADGIHSTVRTQLWGAERPRFTGNVAWRALVPAARMPEGLIRPVSTAWWGPGRHFVHYFVRRGALINCVCVVEAKGWEVESWTEPGEIEALRAAFEGWHPDVCRLIEQMDTTSLFKWALHDRAPMPQWGRGRVTLLGDACHATLPFMAQGAAMAIEDAAVLASCLDRDGSIEQKLALYEDLRKARTAHIQRGSSRNAKLFHMSGLPAWLRNRAVRTAGTGVMDRLYAYNPLTAVQ